MPLVTLRNLILAAVALTASACTPMAGGAQPDTAVPGQSVDAASCAARGGEIRRVGRMQSEQCIILFADAGKQCTDNAQCQGDCRAPDGERPDEGAAAVGQCSPDSTRFGCHTTIEDGKVEHTLCVD